MYYYKYIIVRFIYLVTIKYVNSNNYCILAIYYLRTCKKLTKAYREVEMLCTIKTKQNVFIRLNIKSLELN